MEEDGDKDRLVRTKIEASEAFGIKFPSYRFGQDNRTILAIPEKNEITSSLSSIKGFGSDIGNNLFELAQTEYATFVDFLINAEECGKMSKKFIDLIKIKYFDNFGKNKKLLTFFEEFTKGKTRYSKTHSDKTKTKRVEELNKIWEELPDESLSIIEQIINEQEILGYITATYPDLSKKYVYVTETDVRFAPRLQCYCLANGTQASLKIQKRTFDNNPILAGDILHINKFEKKIAVKYNNGIYEEQEGEYTWWISSCSVLSPEEFDKIVQ
jgi:DNA polymerase III alpha subunit